MWFSIYYRLILDKNSELWNLLEALKHYFVDSVGYEFRGKHLSATKGELKIKFTVQDSTSSVFTNDVDESYNLQITSSNESVSAWRCASWKMSASSCQFLALFSIQILENLGWHCIRIEIYKPKFKILSYFLLVILIFLTRDTLGIYFFMKHISHMNWKILPYNR